MGGNENFYFEMSVHFMELVLVIGIALTIAWTRRFKKGKRKKEDAGPVPSSSPDL